jgi:hypothetical protein
MFSCKGNYLSRHKLSRNRRISGAASKNSQSVELPTKEGNRDSLFQIVLPAGVTASAGWAIDLCLPALAPLIAPLLSAQLLL